MLLRLAGAVGLIGLAGCATSHVSEPQGIGLFGTLPLMWQESDSLGDLLKPAPPHWALEVLRSHGALRPLDSLERLPKGGMSLVLAQPRPLSAEENVALDRWVRRGGRVLIFADPLLTAESQFAFGDKRRPQDVVLLSPILARWGLTLEFDDEQPDGPREVVVHDSRWPVNMAGNWRIARGARCEPVFENMVVRCKIGRGIVVGVADAAILESVEAADAPARQAALTRLLEILDP